MILKQRRGDTIVEVLISLAIIGVVLGAAYTVNTRSFRTGQTAQERIEALKLAEGQIERIKYQADNDENFVTSYKVATPSESNWFCFDASNVKQSDALVNPSCSGGANGIFTYGISYDPGSNPGADDQFVVTVYWEKLGGGPRQVVELRYRI